MGDPDSFDLNQSCPWAALSLRSAAGAADKAWFAFAALRCSAGLLPMRGQDSRKNSGAAGKLLLTLARSAQ